MGIFYGLSSTKNTKKIYECDYIIYLDLPSHSNNININNIKYFIFPYNFNFSYWDVNDDIIDVLGYENSIKVKFQKISNFDNYELWKKINNL